MPIDRTDQGASASLTRNSWLYSPDHDAIIAPGEWSDDDGKHFDYRYPRVVAHLPDDWDQSSQGPLISAAIDMLKALKWARGMANEAILLRADSDDPAGRECLELHREALAECDAAIAKATGQ